MEATQIVRPNSGLSLVGDPTEMLDAASKVAKVLMQLVRDRQLSQKFGKKEHIMVDAWLTLGSWFGVSATCPENLIRFFSEEQTGREGYIATARLVSLATGELLGIEATAECDNFEDNWGTRPKYEWVNNERRRCPQDTIVPRFQLRSMAQTRAIGKVMSIKYRHIVVLAGFETTPAEEITGTERSTAAPQDKKADAPQVISEGQRKRIYAIAHEHGVPMPEIVKLITAHGFKIAAEITRDKYDAIVKNIEGYKP